jgi:hypothetical protein
MKRYVIFALAAPVVAWAGFVVIGKKRADNAGMMFVTPNSLGVPLPSLLALEAAAAGVLVAYLTK